MSSPPPLTVQMPLGGFEDISRYNLWIEGVLPGVPLEAGRDSLIVGAREAFKELGLKTSPRNWLLVVAGRAKRLAQNRRRRSPCKT